MSADLEQFEQDAFVGFQGERAVGFRAGPIEDRGQQDARVGDLHGFEVAGEVGEEKEALLGRPSGLWRS